MNQPNKPLEKPIISIEEDIPPLEQDDDCSGFDFVPPLKKDATLADEEERKIAFEERRDKLKTRRDAYALLKICLPVTIGMYLLDVLLVNVGLKNSEMLTAVFEFSKLVSTTLLGYAFASHQRNQ